MDNILIEYSKKGNVAVCIIEEPNGHRFYRARNSRGEFLFKREITNTIDMDIDTFSNLEHFRQSVEAVQVNVW